MNKLKSYPNKSDYENRMIKKDLKELKMTTNTNKVHLIFQELNHKHLRCRI